MNTNAQIDTFHSSNNGFQPVANFVQQNAQVNQYHFQLPPQNQQFAYHQSVNSEFVSLKNKEQWNNFHHHVNEMLVQNHGRALFPKLECQFHFLNPTSQYQIGLKMLLITNQKYRFENTRWNQMSGQSRGIEWATNEVYSEVKNGEEVMGNGFDLSRKKIYNIRSESKTGKKMKELSSAQLAEMILVVPQHWYVPQLTLYRFNEQTGYMESVFYGSFRETEFVAVTGYKNPEIVKLKKSGNKFVRKDMKEDVRYSVSPPTSSESSSASPQSKYSGDYQNYH